MYGSKFMSDLEDDYPCEEIIVSQEVLRSEPLSRKKDKKGKCCRQTIEDKAPCAYSHSREESQRVKPKKVDSKVWSTSKDTKGKKSKRKRTLDRREETYNADNECSDPDCSIIYSNPFDEEDRTTAEFLPRMGCCAGNRTENDDESDSNLYVSTQEKHPGEKGCGSCHVGESYDFQDDKSNEFLPDIPSIPEDDLYETAETKPEPEILATALLMSETEDLQNTTPNEIFDKLFSDTASSWSYMTGSRVAAGLESTKRVEGTVTEEMSETTKRIESVTSPIGHSTAIELEDINETTMDETSSVAFRESELKKITPKMDDTTGDLDLSTIPADNTRGEWMKDDDMLEFVMKTEAVAAPAYRNYVRLNGSVKPSWFAGYALVSPLLPNCIRITSDPGEALHEAWRLCRPRHFDEFSKSFPNTA